MRFCFVGIFGNFLGFLIFRSIGMLLKSFRIFLKGILFFLGRRWRLLILYVRVFFGLICGKSFLKLLCIMRIIVLFVLSLMLLRKDRKSVV